MSASMDESPPPPEQQFRVSELARLLKLDRRTINRMIESGDLPAVDINPSSHGRPWWRVSESSISQYLQHCADRPRRRKAKPPDSAAIKSGAAKTARTAHSKGRLNRRVKRVKPLKQLV